MHKVFSRFNNFTLKDLNTEVNVVMDESLIKPFEIRIDDIDESDFKIKEWKEFKISDYFDVVKIKTLKINDCEKGNYPLISSSKFNYGICKYINTYSIEGEFISVARNGSVGSSFYQNGQISITTDIILLKPLKDINLHLMAMLLNYYLPSKYSYNNKLTINKLMNEIIKIPIFE